VPTIRINGGSTGDGGGQRPGGLNSAWEKLLSNPSLQSERQFWNRYAMHTGGRSALFGGGGGGAGGAADLRSAAAALQAAAGAQMAAAARIAAGGGILSARLAAAAGVGGGGRFGGGGSWHYPLSALPGPAGRVARIAANARAGIGALGELAGLGMAGGIGGGLGIAGAVAAAAGYAAIRTPLWVSSLERGLMGEANPYTKYMDRVYGTARAGGFRGGELARRFFPGEKGLGGAWKTPEWMAELGLRPDEAADLLSQYGIVPGSAHEGERLVRQLVTMQKSPAFSGMNPSAITGFARQARSLGLGGNPSLILGMISRAMEDAVARGMDRAQILRSMQGSMSAIAQRSAGFAFGGISDLYARMMGSGIPGARTGAAEQRALGGLESMRQSLGAEPFSTSMAARLIKSYGGLKNRAQLEKLLGPELYGQLASNPVGAKLMRRTEELGQAGMLPLQIPFLKELFAGNPARLGKLLWSQIPNTGNAALNDLFGSSLEHMSLTDFYATRAKPRTAGPMGARTDRWLQLLSGNAPFAGGEDYAAELRRAGVPAALIPHFIASGKRHNVSPVELAALSWKESRWKTHAWHVNRNRTIDLGVAQINSATAKRLGIGLNQLFDPATNIDAEAALLAEANRRGRNPIRAYNPGSRFELRDYQAAVLEKFGGMPPGYAERAETGQSELEGAKVSFDTLGSQVIPRLNTALAGLAGVVEKAERAFENFHLPRLQ
jgi:hypothetical protein